MPTASVLRRLAAAAAGTAATLDLGRRLYRRTLPPPEALPPALDGAAVRTFEMPEGRVNVYVRPGAGPPVVFVHSFNAAASSREVAPLFEHLATTTRRPLYALDWLGFGRSARPAAAAYGPALYQRQLRSFLATLDAPADLVALSLGGEHAAAVTLAQAPLVRRLVLVAPTGLGPADQRRGPAPVGRIMIRLADRLGAFELLFYPLTLRRVLRGFYARQVFRDPTAVPDALVDYAYATTHVRGVHHAPRRFVDGTLYDVDDPVRDLYARLYRPTLLLVPAPAPGEAPRPDADDPDADAALVQRFDRADALVAAHPRDLRLERLPGGLLPHWEAPQPCFEALRAFLDATTLD